MEPALFNSVLGDHYCTCEVPHLGDLLPDYSTSGTGGEPQFESGL